MEHKMKTLLNVGITEFFFLTFVFISVIFYMMAKPGAGKEKILSLPFDNIYFNWEFIESLTCRTEKDLIGLLVQFPDFTNKYFKAEKDWLAQLLIFN